MTRKQLQSLSTARLLVMLAGAGFGQCNHMSREQMIRNLLYRREK